MMKLIYRSYRYFAVLRLRARHVVLRRGFWILDIVIGITAVSLINDVPRGGTLCVSSLRRPPLVQVHSNESKLKSMRLCMPPFYGKRTPQSFSRWSYIPWKEW